MSNVIRFQKPDNSKARFADEMVDLVKNAAAERERLFEREQKLRSMSQQLGPIIQNAYGLLGIVDADQLITWLMSAKREEFRAKQGE